MYDISPYYTPTSSPCPPPVRKGKLKLPHYICSILCLKIVDMSTKIFYLSVEISALASSVIERRN